MNSLGYFVLGALVGAGLTYLVYVFMGRGWYRNHRD
jgi:hypothetical protein